MSKGKNQQVARGTDSALEPGVQAPGFKLRSRQSLHPDRETGAPGAPALDSKLLTLPPDPFISPLDVNPGADGILDALEALDSKREVAA